MAKSITGGSAPWRFLDGRSPACEERNDHRRCRCSSGGLSLNKRGGEGGGDKGVRGLEGEGGGRRNDNVRPFAASCLESDERNACVGLCYYPKPKPVSLCAFVLVCFVCAVLLPRVVLMCEEGVEDFAQLPHVTRSLRLPRQALHLTHNTQHETQRDQHQFIYS